MPTKTPRPRIISPRDVRAIFAPFASQFAALAGSKYPGVLDVEVYVDVASKTLLYEGDVALPQMHLAAEGPSVIVLGDLAVEKTLKQDFRAGSLAVLGNLQATSIMTTGEMLVTGDLHVAETMFGNSTNYMTHVLGAAHVGALVSVKSHVFAIGGKAHSKWRGSRTIRKIVDAEEDENIRWRTDVDEGFAEEVIFAALQKGESLFATAKTKTSKRPRKKS